MALLWFSMPAQHPALQIDQQQELLSGAVDFPELDSYFQADRLHRLVVSSANHHELEFQQVIYKDEKGTTYTALIDPHETSSSTPVANPENNEQAWHQLTLKIKQLPAEPSVLLSWWDNSQRVHFFTGSQVWLTLPVAEMFAESTQAVWQQLSGGFSSNATDSRHYAEWLMMDADNALKAIQSQFKTTSVRLLASIDDLSRLSEIAALTNQPIPFETRTFQIADNLHSLISQVKRWSKDSATGSYLIQKISPTQIRAWKITSPAGEQTLMARMLPFTSSLALPIDGLELLFRSKPGGLLSLYQVVESS